MLGLIISIIVVGLIAGAVARLVVPGRQNLSVPMTIVIGIVAALFGSLLARGLGIAHTSGVDWVELGLQVLLAALGVAIVAGGLSRRSVR